MEMSGVVVSAAAYSIAVYYAALEKVDS